MKVKDLIAALSVYPDDTNVTVIAGIDCYTIYDVETGKTGVYLHAIIEQEHTDG
jgi:hypothetical protein